MSTPLARPVACVAPPAQFGKLVQTVGEVSVETPMARPPEYPVPVPRAGYRPRTLSERWMIQLLWRDVCAIIWSRLISWS